MIEKQFYGSPNYGETPETDEKVMVFILKTDDPVNVLAAPNQPDPETADQSVYGITEIQAYTMNKKLNLSKYLNKKVILQGTLMAAISGHHYTKILMEVKQIDR